MKCVHKWIDMEDGSLDKICVKCSKKAKQAVAYMPLGQDMVAPSIEQLAPPNMRETIIINTGNSNLGKVAVYKDDLLKRVAIQHNFLK